MAFFSSLLERFYAQAQRQKTAITAFMYAINPSILGDDQALAWTNLGLWSQTKTDYPYAAAQLAKHMGDALQIKSTDHLLDIGCGHGASLVFWHQQYAVQHIAALELQPKCCKKIAAQQLPYLKKIIQQSIFFDQNNDEIHSELETYDVIISLDLAYHFALSDYLTAIKKWQTSNCRIGFHTLIKTEQFATLSSRQQKRLARLLRCAKVNLDHLLTESQLKKLLDQQHFTQIQCEDLSKDVLQGFAQYIESEEFKKIKRSQTQNSLNLRHKLNVFKIQMTAKLCQILYATQGIAYVQVTAKTTTLHHHSVKKSA